MTGYQVKQILFEYVQKCPFPSIHGPDIQIGRGDRASGVEFLPNPRFHPDEEKVAQVATAKKLVVLSAGAFGSPAVLERSGIGAAERLSKLGIKPLSDLPGVGENYQGAHHRKPASGKWDLHKPYVQIMRSCSLSILWMIRPIPLMGLCRGTRMSCRVRTQLTLIVGRQLNIHLHRQNGVLNGCKMEQAYWPTSKFLRS